MLVAAMSIMAYLLSSPFEITRVRNALIAEVGDPADFNWKPQAPPADYTVERHTTPPEFVQALQGLQLFEPDMSEASRALAIARHLTSGDKTTGKPIQSNTLAAYHSIVASNEGYCSDYTQVFNALNLAAGIPVREWGMSFDGFSGKGHAFSEIYDSTFDKWVFVDSFFSFYMVDAVTGIPLSVDEFRKRLLAEDASLSEAVVPIDAGAFSFKTPQKAVNYYAAGAEQFFLWFGNDVFSYDSNPIVASAARFGRSFEQALAIVVGAHPEIRIVPTPEGKHWLRQLQLARWKFAIAVLLGLVGCAAYVYAFAAARRRHR